MSWRSLRSHAASLHRPWWRRVLDAVGPSRARRAATASRLPISLAARASIRTIEDIGADDATLARAHLRDDAHRAMDNATWRGLRGGPWSI